VNERNFRSEWGSTKHLGWTQFIEKWIGGCRASKVNLVNESERNDSFTWNWAGQIDDLMCQCLRFESEKRWIAETGNERYDWRAGHIKLTRLGARRRMRDISMGLKTKESRRTETTRATAIWSYQRRRLNEWCWSPRRFSRALVAQVADHATKSLTSTAKTKHVRI